MRLSGNWNWFFTDYLGNAFIPGALAVVAGLFAAAIVPALLGWILKRLVRLPPVSGATVASGSELRYYAGPTAKYAGPTPLAAAPEPAPPAMLPPHQHRRVEPVLLTIPGRGQLPLVLPGIGADLEDGAAAKPMRIGPMMDGRSNTTTTAWAQKMPLRSGRDIRGRRFGALLSMQSSTVQALKTMLGAAIFVASLMVAFSVWRFDMSNQVNFAIVSTTIGLVASLLIRDFAQPFLDALCINIIGPIQVGDYMISPCVGRVIALGHMFIKLEDARNGRLTQLTYATLMNMPFVIINERFEDVFGNTALGSGTAAASVSSPQHTPAAATAGNNDSVLPGMMIGTQMHSGFGQRRGFPGGHT